MFKEFIMPKLNRLVLPLLMLMATGALCAQFAQGLFFSEYVEGSSNNKAIEIFNGTGQAVDLTAYTVKLASNGGTWSTTNILALTGTLAHNDVFVIANSQANATILGVSDATSTVTYFNGDDALGLFQGDTLIDIFGVYQNDPGTAWPVAGVADATLNHTLIRKPTVISGVTDWSIAAGTNADDSQWIVQAIDYITDLGVHTFTPGGGNNTATPVFNPGGGAYTAPVSVTITCSTPNSSIFYTTDGSTPNTASTPYSTPLNVSTATTLKAIATAPGMDPSYVATAVYSFPVTVANLTVLRSSPADGTTIYHVTGEVVLTFKQTFRNQKYLQDGGAGILVDDLNGVISTVYNVGDGITGITGKISEYAGMLQFVPTSNTPAASSTNNPIVPVVVSFDQMVNAFDTYESRVVKVLGVQFVTPTGNFANGTVYACYDQDTDFNIRTTFYDVDYINTPIPSSPKDIVGIPNSRTDGNYFTPRLLADFIDPAGTVAAPVFDPNGGVYLSPVSVSMTSATAGASIHYTLDGSAPTAASTLYVSPITISTTTTLKAIAVLPGSPSSGITTATYSYPVTVSNLSALRSAAINGLYRVQNEVLLSFKQSFRNQKFVQDDQAGILIDDLNGVITTNYQVGDEIGNVVGTLTEFGGMLQLVPAQDFGQAISTDNPVVPVPITIDQFINSFEAYESRLVTIGSVIFSNSESNYANGTVYPFTNVTATQTANFRATFYDVDYIGVHLQPWVINITGIPNSRTDGTYFTARGLADFQINDELVPLVFAATVNNPHSVSFEIGFDAVNNVNIPVGLTGYKLYRNGSVIQVLPADLHVSHTDTTMPNGTSIYHATAVYGAYESEPTADFEHIITSTDDPSAPASVTRLKGNWPNPFNPSTTISFSLREASQTRVEIFNSKGQKVRTLLNDTKAAGDHSIVWNGKDDSGQELGSGIYFFRMQSGKYSSTRKMLLLK